MELGGDVLAYYRREAARRDLTSYQLVRDLLDTIAIDALVPAVLDNRLRADGSRRPALTACSTRLDMAGTFLMTPTDREI